MSRVRSETYPRRRRRAEETGCVAGGTAHPFGVDLVLTSLHGLQAGVGGPDEDPAAFLVADDLVRRGAADLVQLHGREHLPAAAALAAAQRRRGDAADARADLVVQGQEVGRDVGDDRGAGGGGLGGLLLD